MKTDLKHKAIELRRLGFSYSEILSHVPVAKSTLSLWLNSIGLSKKQKQRLTQKKLNAILRGAIKRKNQRLKLIQKIRKQAKKEIPKLDRNSLWLAGIMLYWAEGTKQKEYNVSQGTIFNNSDPKMIKLFLKWLYEIIYIKKTDIDLELYIHKNSNHKKALKFWSKITNCDINKFKIYFKKPKNKTIRKNIKENYNGLLRIKVKKSTNLNRKISAWVYYACKYWGIV